MSRDLVTIGEHTVDASLLTPRGWVLDAGCRDFTFAREMVRRDCRVIALDADPTVERPKNSGIDIFANRALARKDGEMMFSMDENPEARHLVMLNYQSAPNTVRVRTVSVMKLMEIVRLTEPSAVFDAVKLDIEGAEYDILRDWPGPVAKQISVEFHEHVKPRPQSIYDEIMHHLGQWYDLVQHEKTRRHCAHPNYWDSLWVLKESA